MDILYNACVYAESCSVDDIRWDDLGLDAAVMKAGRKYFVVLRLTWTDKHWQLSQDDVSASLINLRGEYRKYSSKMGYCFSFEQDGQLFAVVSSSFWGFIAYSFNVFSCFSSKYLLPTDVASLPFHVKLLHAFYYFGRAAHCSFRLLKPMLLPFGSTSSSSKGNTKQYRLRTSTQDKTSNESAEKKYRKKRKRLKRAIEKEKKDRHDADSHYDAATYLTEEPPAAKNYEEVPASNYDTFLPRIRSCERDDAFGRLLDMILSYLNSIKKLGCDWMVEDLLHPYTTEDSKLDPTLSNQEFNSGCLRASLRSLLDMKRNSVMNSAALVKVFDIVDSVIYHRRMADEDSEDIPYVGSQHMAYLKEIERNARRNLQKVHSSETPPSTIIRSSRLQMLYRMMDRVGTSKLYWFMLCDVEYKLRRQRLGCNFGVLKTVDYWPSPNFYLKNCIRKQTAALYSRCENRERSNLHTKMYEGLTLFLHAIDKIRHGIEDEDLPQLLSIDDIVRKLGGCAFDAAVAINRETKQPFYSSDFFPVSHCSSTSGVRLYIRDQKPNFDMWLRRCLKQN